MDYKEDICSICWENIDNNFQPLEPCGHYIHKKCIYLTGNPFCPYCNKNIFLSKKDIKLINKTLNNNNIQELKQELKNELIEDLKDELRKEKIIAEEINRKRKFYLGTILFIISVLGCSTFKEEEINKFTIAIRPFLVYMVAGFIGHLVYYKPKILQ
jgi:hypothetical protein